MQEGNNNGAGTYLGVRGFAAQQDEYAGKSFSLEHSFYGIVNSSINFFRGAGMGGGFLTFTTSENIERMRITNNGNLLVGKTSQANTSYKVDVNGSVRSNKVVVNVTGADFVFDKEYELKTLEEVEAYINENKHLPDIASADEMETSGLETRLQEVEELTLYLIALKKEVGELKEQNEKLKQ